MTTQNQNLRLYRGDSHVLHVALTNADGTPYDSTIPGIVMRYRITQNPDDDTLSNVRKSLGDGITVVAGTGVDITLDAADTDLRPGLYYHELKVWDGVDPATVMVGYVVIRPAARMGEEAIPPSADLALSTVAPTHTP